MKVDELKKVSKAVRKDIIQMIGEAKSGHPGGSLSLVEILVTLYYCVMNVRPKDPNWMDRDRLVLSKGHGAPALYSVLAHKGFYEQRKLLTLRKFGSFLQGHPDKNKTPGIDVSTGSLGQGLSVATGLALGAKVNKKNYRIFAILGDGEMQEGQIWEALMAAIHYELDNLTIILDYNKLQIDGSNREVMSLGNIGNRIQSFGFDLCEVDGHSFEELVSALKKPARCKKPRFIVANTVKGKGVSFMENEVGWHGKAPNKEEMKKALYEIGGK